MNKIEIQVPDYVNYISEWNELDMNLLKGHIIMDKTITGCGFTEYFLRNTQNVVLCSPRKILLENKSEQNNKIFYVKNELEKSLPIDQDIDSKTVSKSLEREGQTPKPTIEQLKQKELEKKTYILQLKDRISQYIDQCFYEGRPFKILVTYDSIKHVLDVLKSKFTSQAIDTIQFVVDEFQSIFSDARFKGNVELDFIDHLQNCSNVCYLSATPMIEKYLDQIDEFKDLPYYKLIWNFSKVTKAKIIRKNVKSISEEVGNIIEQYRNGHFPRKILEDKSIHESKEVVFYVNSVRLICEIIRRFGLTPAETNIICSRDVRNKKKLKAVKHDFGKVPTQTEKNKMFTFCTRTVYLGSDFYSTSAYTVVCSDCNIETLSVDISLDLPQILGRQRLSENVFRNECLLFYKTQKKPITKEDFDKKVEWQIGNSNKIFSLFEKGDNDEKIVFIGKIKDGLSFKYKSDFVSISNKTGLPAYNKLVEMAERRAWEVRQTDYQDDITVRRTLESFNYNIQDLNKSIEYKTIDLNCLQCNFMEEFSKLSFFHEKMRLYCDFLDSYYDLLRTTDVYGVPREFQNYVNLLGTKRIKALEYLKKNLENEYSIMINQDSVRYEILKNFQLIIYPAAEIKPKLQKIYDSFKLKKTAKATDINNYFITEMTSIRIDGKKYKAFKLLGIK